MTARENGIQEVKSHDINGGQRSWQGGAGRGIPARIEEVFINTIITVQTRDLESTPFSLSTSRPFYSSSMADFGAL
jgi:hypothetical protein